VASETVSVAERVQHDLHPLTSFVVVPIFALANAGVRITGDALSSPSAGRVAAGVALGLVAGKTLGVTAASALAVRLRLSRLPDDVSWPQIVGVAAVAGVGFTVSLFVSGLAFDEPELGEAAKLAVLVASVIASLLGAAVLVAAGRSRARDRADA
jgi:NhaA family Na+:H+ antiporter